MNPENSNPSNRNKLSRTNYKMRQAVAGLAVGATVAVGGATAFEGISNHHAAQEAELLRDTTEYTVQEGGYVSEVAAQLPGVEDTTYASKIILKLNQEFENTNIIPDNEVITIPKSYVDQDSSIDLENNSAHVVVKE